jgi:hypothetical protein
MHRKSYIALAITLGVGQEVSASGFIEDSKATLELRNFYFNQDTRNQRAPTDREWGQSFMLNFQSGFTEGVFGAGLDLQALYGVRLDASGRAGKRGEDNTPGSVFPLSHGQAANDFSKPGATAKFRLSKTQLKVGTLMPKTPVLTYGDGRLLPQTFRGWQVEAKEFQDVNIIAGRIEQVIDRNSTNGQGMSIAGANNPQKGKFSNQFYYSGADYQATTDLKLQYYYGSLEDFYQQHFLGLTHNWQLPAGKFKTDLRYFYSTSDGKNSSVEGRKEGYVSAGYFGGSANVGKVDNRLWSSLFTYNLLGHSLSVGYQSTRGESDFPHLNQGQGRTIYLITNAQSLKFVNAGEDTTVAAYSYDFSNVGVSGLTSGFTYLSGRHIQTATQTRSEWEHDFRIDYVFPQGPLKGLGLTWRNAVLRGNDSADKDESRLLVTYSLPIF